MKHQKATETDTPTLLKRRSKSWNSKLSKHLLPDRVFIVRELQALRTLYGQRLRDAASSLESIRDIRAAFDSEIDDYRSYLQQIYDENLVKKAERMGFSLDDLPVPSEREQYVPPHFTIGPFGTVHLLPDSRANLSKIMRERLPAYRKERREVLDLYIRTAAAATGIIGGLTGLIAILNKN